VASNDKLFIEIHYYEGGFKTEFMPDISRPLWLPNAEMLGVDNNISLPEDGIVVEVSRHKRENHLSTWIGAFVASNDLVYGSRSNHVGVGVWLNDYFAVSTDKILDALLKITWLIKKSGYAAAVGPSNALLSDPAFLQSWISPLSELPDITSGLNYESSGFPQASYIDAGVGSVESAPRRIASSFLLNQLMLEPRLNGSSRLVYIASQSVPKTDICTKELKKIHDSNATSTLLRYFSQYIKKTKEDIDTAYTHRDIAQVQITALQSQQQELLSRVNEAETLIRSLQSTINSLEIRNESFKESLCSISRKTSPTEILQSVFQLSSNLENGDERVALQRTLQSLVTAQNGDGRGLNSTLSARASDQAKQPVQQPSMTDIRVLIGEIRTDIAKLQIVGGRQQRNLGDPMSSKTTEAQLSFLRNDLYSFVGLRHPIGVGIVVLSVLLSSFFIYSINSATEQSTKKLIEGISDQLSDVNNLVSGRRTETTPQARHGRSYDTQTPHQ
jgi:hypothetical protein